MSSESKSHGVARGGIQQRKPKENASSPSLPAEGMPSIQEDDEKLAFKKIVSLVNHADRSEKSIRDRLSRDGFNEDDIDTAIKKALDYGFIDDMRFAEVLVRSRVSQSKGSDGIARELAENGIDATDVEGWPYEFGLSYDEELDRALAYLRRKPPRSKNLREGAYRKLAQRGFPSSIASSAARMYIEEVQA